MKPKNKYDNDNSFSGFCTQCRLVPPTIVYECRRVCEPCFRKLTGITKKEKDGRD